MVIKAAVKNNAFLSRLAYGYINRKVAKEQYSRNKDEMLKIEQLKDLHKGERCFVIGTGPSLTTADLELINNEVSFATNRIYELFDKTDWRPTYYINQDHTLIKEFSDEIKNVDSKFVFLPVDYRSEFSGDKYRFFVLKHKEFYPKPAPFSFDISKYLAQGFTVTYGAIQIAAYMGFGEIYLLGIDHNYNIIRDANGRPVRQENGGSNYSSGIKEYIDIKNLPRVEETTIAYETAEKVSRNSDFRIYNCTRGGKLEAFERKNLEDVVEASK